jgi:hypothetical protein
MATRETTAEEREDDRSRWRSIRTFVTLFALHHW